MQYSLKLLSYKRELGIDSSAKLQSTAYNSTLSCYIELLSNSGNYINKVQWSLYKWGAWDENSRVYPHSLVIICA